MAFRQPITPIPLDATPYSRGDIDKTAEIRENIPGFLSADNNPLFIFLLFAAISIISSGVHIKQKNRNLNDIYRSIEQTIANYEIHDILIAVSPYLDSPEQEAVYSVIGMLEVIYLLKRIMDGSYQVYRMQQTPVLSQQNDKGLGIIKVLSDYIPENRRPVVDKTVQIYESLERLSNNYRIYSNNLKLMDGHKPNPIEQMNEIIRIVKPIIPLQQQNRIDRLQKLLQIAQVMDLNEALRDKEPASEPADQGVQEETDFLIGRGQGKGDTLNDDASRHETKPKEKNDQPPAEEKEKTKAIKQQTSEDKERDQTLEMILGLMKLLSQSSD